MRIKLLNFIKSKIKLIKKELQLKRQKKLSRILILIKQNKFSGKKKRKLNPQNQKKLAKSNQ